MIRPSLRALSLVVCLTLPRVAQADDPKPNVLLIVVDTLRADRLGVYGNQRGLTPFLDELARRGVVFRNAYATSSWTNPSVASLFTSRFPSQHRVTTLDAKLGADEITLGERLAAGGYRLAGFTANFRLTPELGFAQGFTRWKTMPPRNDHESKVRADVVRYEAMKWLNFWVQKRPDEPRLLYLQYMEPHAPYQPSEKLRQRFGPPADAAVDLAAANAKMVAVDFDHITPAEVAALRDLYDGEVASIDAELRALFGELERRGFLRRAIVIVTADHGEEFREHGGLGHGRTLYNDNIHVPLILLAPDVPPAVIDDNVSLADVAPTVLELAALPPEPRFEGRSFAPRLRRATAKAAPDTPVLSELPPDGFAIDRRTHSRALLRGPLKLLEPPKGTALVYDLAADPGEQHPDPPPARKQNAALQKALAKIERELAARARPRAETGVVDAATAERLRALGYGDGKAPAR